MRLKSIEMKNFRRYKDEIVEFPDGLIGIVGKNGAGKSTLIEAIAWGLYGSDLARTKQDEIKRSEASSKDECKVIIELNLDSDAIRIERKLTGKNATPYADLYLNEDPVVHVSGTTAVTKFIISRTRMDHVAFITSIFAKQKDLDRLSDMTGGQRKKTILRLLRIDQIESAIKLLKDDVKMDNIEIEHLTNNLKDIESLKNELIEFKENRSNTIKLIKKIQIYIDKLKDSLKTQKAEFSNLEKKFKQHQSIDKKIEGNKGLLNGKHEEKKGVENDLDISQQAEKTFNKLKPKLIEYEKIKKEKENLDSLKIKYTQKFSFEKNLDRYNQRIKKDLDVNKELEEKLKKFSNLDDKQKLVTEELKQLHKLVDTEQKQDSKIQSIIYEKSSRKTEYEEQLDEIIQLGKKSTCPKCLRPLGDTVSKLSSKYQEDISNLQDEIKTISSQKNNILKKIQLIESEIQSKEKENQQIKKMFQQYENYLTKIETINDTLKSNNNEKKLIEKELKKLGDISYNGKRHEQVISKFKELEKINKNAIGLFEHVKKIPVLKKRFGIIEQNISKLNTELKIFKKQLVAIDFNETQYQKVKQKTTDTEQNYHEQREDLIKNQQILNQIKEQINQQEISIKEENDKLQKIDSIHAKIGTRKKLEKLMSDFKLDLIKRIQPQLSSRTSELFGQITNGRYPTVELDDDFAIKIYDGNKEYPLQRFSGGETDLANLCLRIAISEELSQRSGGSGTQFIALDEIFGSQDEIRQTNILRALQELTNQFRQILLITHVEDVKDSLPYVLNVKENSDNTVSIEEEGNLPLLN